MESRREISMDDMDRVSGGSGSHVSDAARKEFDTCWTDKSMEQSRRYDINPSASFEQRMQEKENAALQRLQRGES